MSAAAEPFTSMGKGWDGAEARFDRLGADGVRLVRQCLSRHSLTLTATTPSPTLPPRGEGRVL